MSEKTCTKCSETKELSDFPRDASQKSGYRPRCKDCESARRREYRDKNQEAIRNRNKDYYEKNKEHLLERNKAYQEENVEKLADYHRSWYKENREKRVSQMKVYREENREELLTKQKVYGKENRDKARARHRKRWENEPEYRAAIYAAKTRRKRLLASAKQEPYTREAIFQRDDWICWLCEESIDPDLKFPDPQCATVDHVIPLSLGGDDTPSNVRSAHLSCNCSKGVNE